MLIGVSGRPITAAALSRDSDTLPSGVARKEYGVVQRMLAQSAVTPAATIFNIVFSSRPGTYKDHIYTLRVWFDADQVRKSHSKNICNCFGQFQCRTWAANGYIASFVVRHET